MFMFVVKHPRRPTQMSVSTDADVRIDRRRCSYRPTQMSVSTDADALRFVLNILRSNVLCVPCVRWNCCSSTDISLTKRCAFKRISLAEWQHLVVELGGRAHAQHLLDDCILSILFSAITIFSRSPLPFVERRSRCRPYFDRIWSFIISR